MKLKPKIVLLYLISVLILLLVSISLLSFVISGVIKGEIANRLETVIRSKTAALNSYFSDVKDSIKELSESSDIRRRISLLLDNPQDEAQVRGDLDEFFEKYIKAISCKNVFFIEVKDGKILYAFHDKDHIGDSLPLGARKDNGLAQIWSKVAFSEETQFLDYTRLLSGSQLELLLGAPVYNDSSKVIGVVVFVLDRGKINKILSERSGLGKDGELYLVGQDSLMRSQSKFLKENTILSQNIDEDAIRLYILNAIKFGHPEDFPALQEKGYLRYKNYHDIMVMANFGYIPELKWAVVAEIANSEVTSAYKDIIRIASLVGVIFLLIVAFFAFEVGGMISKPIEVLRRGTDLIMQGALDHKVGIKTDDELGDLSEAIDKMTNRLKNTYAGLEEKTKEFAKSLEQSERQNKMLEDTKVTMMNILEDLESERKKLQESEVKIRAIIENAIDGIIVLGSNGIIDSVNPAAERIFGYSRDELVGQNIKMVLPEQKQIDKIEEEESLSKSETSDISSWETLGRREIFGKRKDGIIFPMDLSVNEMIIGERKMFAGMFRDITARKDAEKRLVQQKRDLEKINLELDSFVYTASHDLRAPLRGIASFATFLEEDYKDKLDEEGKDYLEEIRKGADRLSALIDDLLALSRISRIKNPYEDVNINELIDSIIERIEFDVKEFNVDLQVQENIPTVHCDRIKLGEVFLNLVNNAIKFSSKNNPENPIVEVKYQDKQRFHEFIVKDNGIGIDPEYHDKIFGIFKRLHKAEEYSGTGAGLSIVKRIVEEHEGEIWVESESGKGAEFHFTIPKALVEKKKLGEMLVEEGILTQDELEKKLNEQRRMT